MCEDVPLRIPVTETITWVWVCFTAAILFRRDQKGVILWVLPANIKIKSITKHNV